MQIRIHNTAYSGTSGSYSNCNASFCLNVCVQKFWTANRILTWISKFGFFQGWPPILPVAACESLRVVVILRKVYLCLIKIRLYH
jgi:hypothetical protein